MKKFRLLLTGFLAVFALGGCQKVEITGETETLLTGQETFTEETLVDIDVLVDEAIYLKFNLLKSAVTEGDYYLTKCPVLTLDSTSTMKILTIDFGTGCTGKDGKLRSGKIIVTSTSFISNTRERVKTFNNFYVEGKKVEGTISKTITINRDDHSKVAENRENVTITFPDNGGKAYRKANVTREYDFNIPGVVRDNTVTTWGKVEFTRISGLKLTKTVNEATPLLFKMSCHQIVSGIVTFTTSDNRTWTIDYGDGTCDRKATITKNGETKTIIIR